MSKWPLLFATLLLMCVSFAWAASPDAATQPTDPAPAPSALCGTSGQPCCSDGHDRCQAGLMCLSRLCPPGRTCPPGQCLPLNPKPSRSAPAEATCSAQRLCATGVCFHNYCMPQQPAKRCSSPAGCDSLRLCVKRPLSAEWGTCEYEGGVFQGCTATEQCNSGAVCHLGQCVPPSQEVPVKAAR